MALPAFTPGTSAYYMRMTAESIQQQVDSHARYMEGVRGATVTVVRESEPPKPRARAQSTKSRELTAQNNVKKFNMCFPDNTPVCIFCRGRLSREYEGVGPIHVTCSDCEQQSVAFRSSYREATSGFWGSFALLWRYASLPSRPVPVVELNMDQMRSMFRFTQHGMSYFSKEYHSLNYFLGYFDDENKAVLV